MREINLLNDWCEICEEAQANTDAKFHSGIRLCGDCASGEPAECINCAELSTVGELTEYGYCAPCVKAAFEHGQ